MAKKTMTPVKAGYNAITKIAFEAASSTTDGFELKFKSNDEYALVVVDGGSAGGTITVKAPTNGSYAAASSDLTLSLSANEKAVIRLESARYCNNDGTITLIPSVTTVTAVAVI